MIDPLELDYTNSPAAGARPSFTYVAPRLEVPPLLSIVTPLFNTDPNAFEETARCVVGQSFQHWEWVIVDDGSSVHECRQELADWSRRDGRIHTIRGEVHRGVSHARNVGISHARSDYILQIDSDDLIEPTAAEKWLWFLTSHPELSWVNSFHVAFGDLEYLWPSGAHDRETFLKESRANSVGIARRELFAAVGGFDESLRDGLEEWDFWSRCAAAGLAGATVPEYLYWYRRRGGESRPPPRWDEGREQKRWPPRNWTRHYAKSRTNTLARVERAPASEEEIELEWVPLRNQLVKTGRRLLIIVPWVTIGGADKFNLDLVAQLKRREWEVTVVATLPGENWWAPRLARLTPDIFTLEHLLKPNDYPRFFRYLIESRRPDAILIANSVFAYRALPYLRRLARDIPIIDYCHSVAPGWLNGGYPRLSVTMKEHLDLQITSSEYLKDWMVRQGADPARIEICYTNADLGEDGHRLDASRGNEVQELLSRRALALPDELPVIIYPCRIDVEKQPRVFGKTVLELRRRGYRFAALVVGDGPYLDWLKRFVRQHGLQDCVHFLGRQPPDQARRLISVSDCLFLPSQFEGIALTFFEAMAEGVAVVGADVGGQRELVTRDCGVLIERGDEESEIARYTDVLGDLLDDGDKRRAMGIAGRRRIRDHFPLDAMGTKMDDLLEHAQETAQTAPRPTPSAEQAHAAALEAIHEVAWLFPDARVLIAGPLRVRLRWLLFRLATIIGMPIHRLGMRLGMHWIERLRQRIANLLQPKVL